jgi:hypothetical protein
VAVGAIAIIIIFMTVLTCIGIVVMESNRYNQSVRLANEVVAMKARESLTVVRVGSSIKVTNEGSTPAVIVGYLYANPGTAGYYNLPDPYTVQILSLVTKPLPNIPEGYKVGVVTSLGNVFWEKGS